MTNTENATTATKPDNNNANQANIPMVQKIASILWPSFITAGIANSLFFVFFDPEGLLLGSGYQAVSEIAAYSIGFFLFWAVTSSSCFLTSFFLRPCHIPKNRPHSSD